MSEDEAEVTHPTEELSGEATEPIPSDPPVHLEDPKIGSIAITLRKLFPDMYVDKIEEIDTMKRDKDEVKEECDDDTNEVTEEEGEENSEVCPAVVLPYPITEAAKMMTEASQRLDELMARQAEDEIKIIEEILMRQQEERLVEDEKAKKDMKEIHGLDWGRQFPKGRLLLEKCLCCSQTPKDDQEGATVNRCSCLQPKEVLDGISCRESGYSLKATEGGQEMIDSTRRAAEENERYLHPCSILVDSEIRLRYLPTGRLARFPNLVSTSIPEDPNYLKLTYCLKRRRRNKYEWPKPVVP